MKRALVTGIHGQDGQYLAEYLDVLGYEVIGMSRRTHTPGEGQNGVSRFVYGDMRDALSLEIAIRKANPDEIYNLAGQSFVPPSWKNSCDTIDINASGLGRILEIVETVKPDCRVYQASSSEMFGNQDGACNEETPLNPVSPYGVSKAAAHYLAKVYRQKKLFVACGILHNHESPRRGPEMVTRKITQAVAKWKAGIKDKLQLGNLHAARDWGFAGDYVKAMHKMLQQPEPGDYVIGAERSYTVREFLETAIRVAGLNFQQIAEEELVEIDKLQRRPNDLHCLQADASKAHRELNWYAETSFETWIKMMVDADVPRVAQEIHSCC